MEIILLRCTLLVPGERERVRKDREKNPLNFNVSDARVKAYVYLYSIYTLMRLSQLRYKPEYENANGYECVGEQGPDRHHINQGFQVK